MTKILMLLEDCHRPSNGGFDPLERLATIRAKFFDVRGQTLGDEVPITSQDGPFTSGDPSYGEYDIPVAAPNLTRVVVQGSTNCPHAYLRLHADPASDAVFCRSTPASATRSRSQPGSRRGSRGR
jgi:hypothetical protein